MTDKEWIPLVGTVASAFVLALVARRQTMGDKKINKTEEVQAHQWREASDFRRDLLERIRILEDRLDEKDKIIDELEARINDRDKVIFELRKEMGEVRETNAALTSVLAETRPH